MASKYIKEFREKLQQLPRERLLELIEEQHPEFISQIERIEWVFRNRLSHLNWPDGSTVTERPLSQEELSLLIDPPFKTSKDLFDLGLSIKQQEEIHVASDIVLWAREYLATEPRVYQILMLRSPSLRRVYRLGRRAGKTFCIAITLLHYAYTTKDGRCLVMAPMKSQVSLIYEEVTKLAKQGKVGPAITRAIMSPQHEIHMSTGSTMRFFTTGMKSGGKSDVARGQEAHVIVLDEMDYMGVDDLDALLAMLQRTDENQPDKIMIGASTPTGRRERFYQWCMGLSPDGNKSPPSIRFKEFWFPSFVSPLWDSATELEMRSQYSETGFRHEIEADWGEDAEGVYPRKYIDRAFITPNWDYVAHRTSDTSEYFIGVDWDKYNAGPNICVLEACGDRYEDSTFAGKLRLAYRQEIPKNDYVLTEAVQRVAELNERFDPKCIYIDKGYGEVQHEMLLKMGVDNPHTGLRKKVKSVAFGGAIEIIDPVTKQKVKKDSKPYMVENLRYILERDLLKVPDSDENLYMQLIAYIITRTSSFGKPVFGPSGSQVDHAHDALILACLAYTESYGEFNKVNIARHSRSVSNSFFMPIVPVDDEKDAPEANKTMVKIVDLATGKDDEDEGSTPKAKRRRNLGAKKASYNRPIRRRSI